MKIMTSKQVERIVNQTILTSYTLLNKVLKENQITTQRFDTLEKYIKELTKVNKELQK